MLTWLVTIWKVRPWEPVYGSLSGRGFRKHQVPSPWAQRVKNPPLFIYLPGEGLMGLLQPSKAQEGSTNPGLPAPFLPFHLSKAQVLSLAPLAATIRLKRPRGQNHSQCAQLSGNTPTIGPFKHSKECRAVSFTSREVQNRLGQEAQSVNSPQKVTRTRRTGWRSITTLPSKSLLPEEQSRARAV